MHGFHVVGFLRGYILTVSCHHHCTVHISNMTSRVTHLGVDSLFTQTLAASHTYIPDGILSHDLTDLSSMEGDSMPVLSRPVPSAMKLTASVMEPSLCVTPEKSHVNLSRHAAIDGGTKKVKPRVRFDPTVTVELHHQESSRSCSSSSTADIDGDTGQSYSSTDSLSTIASSDDSCLDETLEPISILAADLRLEDRAAAVSTSPPQRESSLATPEINSSRRLDREVDRLGSEELDVSAAVRQKLRECRRTRTNIVEKVNWSLPFEDKWCHLFSSELIDYQAEIKEA